MLQDSGKKQRRNRNQISAGSIRVELFSRLSFCPAGSLRDYGAGGDFHDIPAGWPVERLDAIGRFGDRRAFGVLGADLPVGFRTVGKSPSC